MEFNSKTIGKNIAKFRKLRDMKASEMAQQLGLKEATYTKYERGETAINIDIIQKIGDILDIDPLQILSATPSNFIENVRHSPISFNGNSTLNANNEKQTQLMLKLMENVIGLNERLIELLEKKKD